MCASPLEESSRWEVVHAGPHSRVSSIARRGERPERKREREEEARRAGCTGSRRSSSIMRGTGLDAGLAMACLWLLATPLLLAVGCAAATASAAAATVKAYENETVVLPCHVEDLGLQTRVRWWRKGVLLADSEEPQAATASPRVKMWGNRSLELVQVRPEDSGEYVCQASRPEPWGHVTQAHQIQVMYPARIKAKPEAGQLEVNLGEEVTMACQAEGVPEPTLTWSFEGEELPVIVAGQTLRLHASNRSLAGVYTCQASNGIGEPARANIELKIKHKPEVTAPSRWLHSVPGIRAKLECLVESWPEARVSWYLDGEKLARSERILLYKQDWPAGGQLHSLVVRSVQPYDFGQYVCQASNALGAANASVELSGLPKPPLLKKEARTHSSTSHNFIWDVDSYSPIIEYQFWFRQVNSGEEWHRLVIPSVNEAAASLHARSFNLTGLHASRQYEALVLARNRFGWSSPSRVVKFATVPAPATEEEAYRSDNESVEKMVSAVQVTSDSHRSATEVNSSGRPCGDSPALLLLLLLLLVFPALPLRGKC